MSEIKLPKSLGACVDKLFETRQKRLEIQKQVESFQELESALKDHIINTLPKSEASGIAGKLARVTVVKKVIAQASDWDAFYKYVKKTGSFDLMQRRLNDAAVKERWDNGEKIPGVESFTAVTLSVNKL
jgi:hypothetical protein